MSGLRSRAITIKDQIVLITTFPTILRTVVLLPLVALDTQLFGGRHSRRDPGTMQLGHGLRKVHVDPFVINENILHLEVGSVRRKWKGVR